MRPVYCNSIQIEQVLTNLLINARDALENAQEKTVTLRSFESDNCIVVEIEDSGKGIPAADLPKVFDPFFTSKEVGKGTGLGLSISYGIIEDHGGRLSVMNQEEGGARFRMELPLREVSLR